MVILEKKKWWGDKQIQAKGLPKVQNGESITGEGKTTQSLVNRPRTEKSSKQIWLHGNKKWQVMLATTALTDQGRVKKGIGGRG